MAKTKTVKAKVTKVKQPKQPKRMSKGRKCPWELYAVDSPSEGHHGFEGAWKTRKEVLQYTKEHPRLLAPVIVHIDIPPMEY